MLGVAAVLKLGHWIPSQTLETLIYLCTLFLGMPFRY